MNSLKKIFGVIMLLTAMIIPQIVSAEKTDWSDNSYRFKAVKTVVVLDFDTNSNMNGISTAIMNKLRGDYQKDSKKIKCQVLTEEQAKSMLGVSSRRELLNNINSIADLWVSCKITTWNNGSYVKPAYTTYEQQKRKRKVRDNYGDWIEEEYYETVPVTHPPTTVYTSDIVVDFEVYDTKTNRSVFSREDNRSRDDKDAQKDMFGRICNSFFSDFGKKIK